jgi:hypothetical protein
MCPKPKPEYRQLPKDAWRSAGDQVTLTHKRNCLIRGLTPELSRAAQWRKLCASVAQAQR